MLEDYNEKLRVCVAEIEKLGNKSTCVDPEPRYDVQDDEVFLYSPSQ